MKARRDLEHRLWERLKKDGLEKTRFLIACSGGADSVALLRAFAAVRPARDLHVVYVHHGPGSNGKFRDKARDFVASLCRTLSLPFEEARHEGAELRGEAALRRRRRDLLHEIQIRLGAEAIVTAHHAEDLLETRLIRLIRGTGPEGFGAIRPWRSPWYRPFLETSKKKLRRYLQELDQPWLEDPSNQDKSFLRNWLRQEWLPALEAYRPGASAAMARSFSDVAAALVSKKPGFKREVSLKDGFSRADWESWSADERLRELAASLRHAGVSDFTRGQLQEIAKRLDKEQREYTFVVAGCVWLIRSEQIQVRRVVAPSK